MRQSRDSLASAKVERLTGVQASRCAPYAEAVVHEQLDARGRRVVEQVAEVRLCAAEDLHDAGK